MIRAFLATIMICGVMGAYVSAWGADDASPPTAEQAKAPGTLTHSAAKATTFKVATVVTNLAIFSVGTGSIVGGGLLTAFNVSKSWLLFTANDYAWDTYLPTQSNTDSGQAFDVKQSFWRTTGKFLTYKPVDTAIKFASIYLYTASAATMIVYGTASSVVNTGVFYVNDFAWNVYDWWNSPAQGENLPNPAQPHVTLGLR